MRLVLKAVCLWHLPRARCQDQLRLTVQEACGRQEAGTALDEPDRLSGQQAEVNGSGGLRAPLSRLS